MKNILANMSKYCANTIQVLKRAFGRFRQRISTFISHADRKAAGYSGSSVPVTRSKYRGKQKKWWQSKRIIIASCALVVVAAIVLAVVLPMPHDKALASVNSGISFTGDALAAQNGEPVSADAQGAQMVPISQSGDQTGLTTLDSQSIVNEPIAAATPEPTPIPTTPPDKVDLVPGIHDPRIIEIQERLMELDFMDPDEPTDFYGNETEFSLQLFQRKNGLQVDGLIGEKTLTALFSEEALPYTVKLGDRGKDVVAMQERLQQLNYLKAGHTGYFGTDTEAAVKSFQTRNGLSADGNVGEYTREILYSEDARPAKTTSGSSSGGGGSSSGGGSVIAVGNPDEASVDKLIEIAKSKLGCEYTRAGKGPNEFDCSGFVYYCLNTAGYQIGYMTSKGWANCGLPKVTSMSDMARGDIICFKGHVGIYMGDGKMIDAGSSDDQVRICSNIMNSSYWTRNFICARRVF
jgi:peptidoglycan hydrolase-like protein with peptidoglycan-binding domain